MSSPAVCCRRWRQAGTLIVALGVLIGSTLALHAQDDRSERAIEDLAERLVAEVLSALPDDRKQEETSVAFRPLWVDPTRLSRFPDDILYALSGGLSDWLGIEFGKRDMTVRTRDRLMDVHGTLEEYESGADLRELLRNAGADVEIFCRTDLSGGGVYHIELRCSAELLQSAQKLGEERISVPIESDDVFEVVMTDLAARIAEALPGAGELVGVQLTEHGHPSSLGDFVGNYLSGAVAERIRLHERWGSWQPIGAGDESGQGKAQEYVLSGLLTCDADADRIDLYVDARVKKDGEIGAPLFGSRHGRLPVEALPHGFMCAPATKVTLGFTVTNALRVYGGNDDLRFTVTGLTDGDTAAQVLSGSLGRVSGSDVGTYAINFGTLAVTSPFSGKYVLPDVSTLGTYTITTKEVTAGAAVLTKEYDGEHGLSGGQLIGGEVSGAVNGQSLTLSVTGGNYATADVATGITISNPTFAVVAGPNTNHDNYALPSSIDLTGTITKKATTFSGAAASRAYDGTDAVSTAISGTFTPELIGGEVVTISGGIYGSADASTNIPIIEATVGGADAGNYAVTVGAISGAITARTITAIDGVTVVSRTMDGGTTANFDTTQANATGVLASEVADFRAGGLVVTEARPSAEAGTHGVNVRYMLANSGRFKAANYELGSGVGTATLQPPAPTQPSPPQMELPLQPRELRPPIVALPEPIPTPPELLIATDAARDDEAFARASAEHTAESYGAYLRSFPNGRHSTEAWGGVSAVAPTIGVDDERHGSLTGDLLHPETWTPVEVWTLRGDAWTVLSVELVSEGFDASLGAWDEDTGETLADQDLVPGSNAGIVTHIPASGAVTLIVGASDAASRGDYLLRTETSPAIGVNEERTDSLTAEDFIWREAPIQVWTLRGQAGTRLYVDVVTEAFDADLIAMDLRNGVELAFEDLAAGNSVRKELTITADGDATLMVSANGPSSGGDYLLRTRTTAAVQDDEAYERARAENTMESYAAYLRRYSNGRHSTEAWAGVSAVAPTIGVDEERQGSLTGDLLHPETRTPVEVWTLRGDAWTVLSVELVSEGFDASLGAWDEDTGETLADQDLVPGSNAGIVTHIPASGAVTLIVGASDAASRGDYLLRTETSPAIGVNEERTGSLTAEDFIWREAPVQVWTLRGQGGDTTLR